MIKTTVRVMTASGRHEVLQIRAQATILKIWLADLRVDASQASQQIVQKELHFVAERGGRGLSGLQGELARGGLCHGILASEECWEFWLPSRSELKQGRCRRRVFQDNSAPQ
jgi:hypothetical protein